MYDIEIALSCLTAYLAVVNGHGVGRRGRASSCRDRSDRRGGRRGRDEHLGFEVGRLGLDLDLRPPRGRREVGLVVLLVLLVLPRGLDGDVVRGLADGGRGGGILVVNTVVAVVGLRARAESVAVLEGGVASGATVMRHVGKEGTEESPRKRALNVSIWRRRRQYSRRLFSPNSICCCCHWAVQCC